LRAGLAFGAKRAALRFAFALGFAALAMCPSPRPMRSPIDRLDEDHGKAAQHCKVGAGAVPPAHRRRFERPTPCPAGAGAGRAASHPSRSGRVWLENSQFKAIAFCVIAFPQRRSAGVEATGRYGVPISGDPIHDVKDRPAFCRPHARVRLRQLRENAVYEQKANKSSRMTPLQPRPPSRAHPISVLKSAGRTTSSTSQSSE